MSFFFFFKQKTAYEMRISDWSSDVCSSDLMTPEQDIVDLLQWRISRLRAKERAEAQLFRTMAGFAPAFGMVGTLAGLVNLLFLLGGGDLNTISQQMALALMPTFYGILFAKLLSQEKLGVG